MNKLGLYKQKGFSLLELMVVVAIVGILAFIAYPGYRSSVLKSHRADATSSLMDAMQREERYYTENNTYVTDLTQVGLASSSNVTTSNGYYKISAQADPSGITVAVILTATAVGTQANDTCGTFTLNSNGAKTTSSGSSDCW
jgi:type IV pilus assembly protein PilE